jgi:DnaJ-domain-containing protein 1
MTIATNELPGLGAKADKPRLNPDLDLGSYKLTPTEGFILSRIDGRASYEDVLRMSTLGREQTLAILRKLKRSSLILDSQSGRHPSGPKTPPPVQVTDEMLRKAQEKDGDKLEHEQAQVPLLERLDDGSAVDPSELADGADLSDEVKRRLLRLFRRMRKIPPHVLLGVAPDADSATIKRAFAAASKELHPDRYFGKDLGHFREKLAKIFNRISEAMQELEKARKAKR